jgi:hypothetical protein
MSKYARTRTGNLIRDNLQLKEMITQLNKRIDELESVNKENREHLMLFASSMRWGTDLPQTPVKKRIPFWYATKFQRFIMKLIGLQRVVDADFVK